MSRKLSHAREFHGSSPETRRFGNHYWQSPQNISEFRAMMIGIHGARPSTPTGA
jgi:hypothetical protein